MATTVEAGATVDVREALRLMLTIRHFDERALALYRAGEMRGTTHPYIGMEAVGVGVMLALRPDDFPHLRPVADLLRSAARLDYVEQAPIVL